MLPRGLTWAAAALPIEHPSPLSVVALAGGAAGVMAISAAAITAFVFWRRKRSSAAPDGQEDHQHPHRKKSRPASREQVRAGAVTAGAVAPVGTC